jgi:hypothetical protein
MAESHIMGKHCRIDINAREALIQLGKPTTTFRYGSRQSSHRAVGWWREKVGETWGLASGQKPASGVKAGPAEAFCVLCYPWLL